MSAIDTAHQVEADFDALQNAETFRDHLQQAVEYTPDDWPAPMRVMLRILVNYAKCDARVKHAAAYGGDGLEEVEAMLAARKAEQTPPSNIGA